MAVLTEDIQRVCQGPAPPFASWKAAANQNFKQGSIVTFNPADGMCYVGATAQQTYKTLGYAWAALDTTGLAAGAKSVIVQPGIVGWFASGSGGDLITEDKRGQSCYVMDDDTVGLTSGTNTRAVAGMIYEVTADGIAVQFEVIRYG
jgi:hypothetical protein